MYAGTPSAGGGSGVSEEEDTTFNISVGVRFRPAGGVAPPPTEVVLPLHQRLQLIRSAHGCSAAEARRRLWAAASSDAPDPWAAAALDEGKDAAPVAEEDAKENANAGKENTNAEKEWWASWRRM